MQLAILFVDDALLHFLFFGVKVDDLSENPVKACVLKRIPKSSAKQKTGKFVISMLKIFYN